MCFCNMPLSLALGWLLFKPDDEDNDDSDLMKWMKFISFYVWLLVLIPIDIVLLPINLLYGLILMCFNSGEDNFYVMLIRDNCWDPE